MPSLQQPSGQCDNLQYTVQVWLLQFNIGRVGEPTHRAKILIIKKGLCDMPVCKGMAGSHEMRLFCLRQQCGSSLGHAHTHQSANCHAARQQRHLFACQGVSNILEESNLMHTKQLLLPYMLH